MTSESQISRPVQRKNRFAILVTFPADWPDEPSLAGQTITCWYPTEDAATLAAAGFRLMGATA